MNTVECQCPRVGGDQPSGSVSRSTGGRHVYHRIHEVRLQQGVSVRSVARKLGLSMQEVRDQEDPHRNLSIAQLLAWQTVLEAPLVDLLVDDAAPLSRPVKERARLLRVMKTAKAIDDAACDPTLRRFSTMLVDQLAEMMPELREVPAWHSVGQRRTQEELGRIVERSLPDSFFSERI